VSQSKKTLNKVSMVDFHGNLTKRQLAAVIGLFLFASSCCDTVKNRHLFFYALRHYRSNVQFCGSHGWDDPATQMSEEVRQNFHAWKWDLLLNAPLDFPVPGATTTKQPTDLLFVDASVERWAAVHIAANGCLRIHSGEWSEADHRDWNLGSSVCSEPLGIRRALCKAIAPTPATCVVVYTDHSGVVDAVAAPCANCYAYWRLQSFLATFPACVLLRHIAGTSNPADAFTRGPVDLTLEHDASWQALVGSAKSIHAERQGVAASEVENGVDGVTATATAEWRATARNPWRELTLG
jgi:hypothetical protein